MIITAKFASTCSCCRQSIGVGSKIEWSKGAKAVHAACVGQSVPVAIRAYGPHTIDHDAYIKVVEAYKAGEEHR